VSTTCHHREIGGEETESLYFGGKSEAENVISSKGKYDI
jgi:hypothetical protein